MGQASFVYSRGMAAISVETSPLHVASQSGDVDKVRELLRQNKNKVNCTDSLGRTPLHYACAKGDLDMVKMLMSEFSADLEVRDREKDTPLMLAIEHGHNHVVRNVMTDVESVKNKRILHLACMKGNLTLIRELIKEHNTDVHARDDRGGTPLHIAAACGKEQVALALITEFGCDVDIRDRFGQTVLHHACQEGNIGLIRTLILKHNANVNLRDSFCDTPLHIAVRQGADEVALALITEFGCDTNVKLQFGQTVLHWACKSGNISVVQTLILKHNADIDARDNYDDTPLHIAIKQEKDEVALALITEFGCDTNVKGRYGQTVLHWACESGNISLVRTLILKHNVDINARDVHDDTPLHIAIKQEKDEVALALITEFGCDTKVKGQDGQTVLHCACGSGNISLVRTLILKHNADINAKDAHNDTPLQIAVKWEKDEVTLALITEFGCDTKVKGQNGQTMLHCACASGNISLVRTLILKHNADINAKDVYNDTPLHIAARQRKDEVAFALITEFGCDTKVKGQSGQTVLHCACKSGNISLVRTLILKHNADIDARDNYDDTPLHIAVKWGKDEVILALIAEFGCDTNVKGQDGQTVLHCACESANISLVRTLILKHNADINDKDVHDDTPLHIAVRQRKDEVAFALITEFGCDTKVKLQFGRTMLHWACESGNISLVRTLILKHDADINAKDVHNDTPLHIAARQGIDEVAFALITEFGCDTKVKGQYGQTVLHCACESGNISLVRTLILKHNADINAKDARNDTPLHISVKWRKDKVAFTLITEFGCDINIKGQSGQTVLHYVCQVGKVDLVQALIQKQVDSVLTMDNEDDTPLHISSRSGHIECTKVLLQANPPLFIRNRLGKTPIDVASSKVRFLLKKYIEENRSKVMVDYNLRKVAKKRHSGPQHMVRILIIGDPGAGKSSLIEALKREGFWKSLKRVSEFSVPLHTAGIIPSVHDSKHYGKVLFFDFAGDPEYYSSHAAVLENLASSKNGTNIFIIVTDLTRPCSTITSELKYWFTFIEHQRYVSSQPFLILIGSHFDKIRRDSEAVAKKRKIFKEFTDNIPPNIRHSFAMLDCCQSRSNEIGDIQKQIMSISDESPLFELSLQGSILLGLFEKDFSHVTACSIQTIISHIKDTGVVLPTSAESLHPILQELNEIGYLLLIGSKPKDDNYVILNISQLTNHVHETLFSKSSLSDLDERFQCEFQNSPLSIGIIPETILKNILPPYITKECLVQLQYCHEISYSDIGIFPSLAQSDIPDQSLLFFPALCSVDKGNVQLTSATDLSYSIGWLARCNTDSYDYFPPRFLHVLLLRTVFRFTLSNPMQPPALDATEHAFFKRRCTMWKTGVHWRMEEGVECMVEMVHGNKGMVVITKSPEERVENCISIFHKIVSCVIETKAEFCHSIKPGFFLLDSINEADYLSEDNMFAMSDVERVLTSSEEEKKVVVSVTGKREMERTKLLCMRKLTHWDSLFPIDFASILYCLRDIVGDLFSIGLHLKIPRGILEAIEADYPTDTKRRRRELVRGWMSSSLDPPCWWHLMKALKSIEKVALAEEVEVKHSKLTSNVVTIERENHP